MSEEKSLDKSPDRIRRMFDGIAPWYDFLNHLLSLGIDRRWRRRAAMLTLDASTPPGPILDVCCGTGDLALALRRRLERLRRDATIYGIDFSEGMVARGRKKTARFPSIELAEGDALDLPFEPETFSVVAVAFGLRNVGDTARGLAEMVRVCQPGGIVAVLEFGLPRNTLPNRLYRFYFLSVLPRIGRFFSRNSDGAYRYLPESVLAFDTPEEIAERMRSLGLTDVRTVPMTFGIAALIYGRR